MFCFIVFKPLLIVVISTYETQTKTGHPEYPAVKLRLTRTQVLYGPWPIKSPTVLSTSKSEYHGTESVFSNLFTANSQSLYLHAFFSDRVFGLPSFPLQILRGFELSVDTSLDTFFLLRRIMSGHAYLLPHE